MRLLSALVLSASLACVGVQPLAAQAAPVDDVWRLRPGDAVRVQVGDEQALLPEPEPDREGTMSLMTRAAPAGGRLFTVDGAGVALLPLVGTIHVAGRPFPEVREEILAAYRAKLVGTPVQVTPVIRIAVLGEVRQPGLLAVDPTFTVADLLAAAGGVTPLGNDGRITLIGDRGSIRFSLTDDVDVLAQPLRPGDQLVVPRRSWARENLNVLLGAAASVLAAAVTTLILQQ